MNITISPIAGALGAEVTRLDLSNTDRRQRRCMIATSTPQS